MKIFRLLSLVFFTSAASAFLAPTPAHAAAIVAITHEKFDHCGRGFVFCNGHQAYSLTEIENGTLQIPIFPLLPSEVVIVNDTGHAVTNLQLTLSTLEFFSFDMKCLIEGGAQDYFDSCNIAKTSNGFSRDPFGMVSAQITFNAKHTDGIPNGEYFDIKTIGFLPGGYLCGGGSGSGGSGSNGGSGGSTGNSGPPQQ